MFRSLRRLTVVAGSVVALAVGGMVATPSAFASGRGDQPVAQIQVSVNGDTLGSAAPTDFWWTSAPADVWW
jgi:hypothetical protein